MAFDGEYVVDDSSQLAQELWDVEIGTMRAVTLMLIKAAAKFDEKEFNDYLDEFNEKANLSTRTLVENIIDESNSWMEQTAMYGAMAINLLVNLHGMMHVIKGEIEINELLGGFSDE